MTRFTPTSFASLAADRTEHGGDDNDFFQEELARRIAEVHQKRSERGQELWQGVRVAPRFPIVVG